MGDKGEKPWWSVKQACPKAWATERERRETHHCGTCDTTIVNLSRLTQKQARRLYDTGQLECVRYDSGPDGAPVFRQPSPGFAHKAAAAGLAATLAACTPVPDAEKQQAVAEVRRLQGELERTELELKKVREHADKSLSGLRAEVERLRRVERERRRAEHAEARKSGYLPPMPLGKL